MKQNSPNHLKRQASQGVDVLERMSRSNSKSLASKRDEFQSPKSHKSRKLAARQKVQEVDEESRLFYKTKMVDLGDIIGPQFCSLCDRNIG